VFRTVAMQMLLWAWTAHEGEPSRVERILEGKREGGEELVSWEKGWLAGSALPRRIRVRDVGRRRAPFVFQGQRTHRKYSRHLLVYRFARIYTLKDV
jgi:hypothetical protein